MLDACYGNKLLGRITNDERERRAGGWRRRQVEMNESILKHSNVHTKNMLDGIQLLELARKAHALYKRQPMNQKQELIRKLFSNCRIEDGNPHFICSHNIVKRKNGVTDGALAPFSHFTLVNCAPAFVRFRSPFRSAHRFARSLRFSPLPEH